MRTLGAPDFPSQNVLNTLVLHIVTFEMKRVQLGGTWLRYVSSLKVRQTVRVSWLWGVVQVLGHSTQEAELCWRSRTG